MIVWALFSFIAFLPCRLHAQKCRYNDIWKRGDEIGHFEYPERGCKILALGGTPLGDSGVHQLLSSLSLSYVEELHLASVGLTTAGVGSLGKALMMIKNSKLRVLNIYGNEIGDSGAAALAALFPGSSLSRSLKTLGLGVNNITKSGASALGFALGRCSTCTLRILGLYRNNLANQGAKALAKFVVAPDILQLERLYLGGNDIGDEGAIHLSNSLMTNTNLEVLSLEGGSIGDLGAMALAKALQESKSFKALDIRSCLPTRRNCGHSSMSMESVVTNSKGALTRQGIEALRLAVAVRSGELKVTGDVSFV